MSKLNPKQQRFILEYMKDLNATAAAKRAGYSERSAHVTSARLLANAKVAAEIQKAREKAAIGANVTIERTLMELVRLGMSDLRKLFTDDGRFKDPSTWDDDTAAAVSSIEVVTKSLPTPKGEEPEIEYIHKIKLWDKNSALEKIAKHLGMFIERHKVEGEVSYVMRAPAVAEDFDDWASKHSPLGTGKGK